MFDKDVSYLYSDDFLTATSSNKNDLLCTKLSHHFECRPMRTRNFRMSTPSLGNGHRTKHIILFREEILKRDKQRKNQQLVAQLTKSNHLCSEENLPTKFQELISQQSHLKSHFPQSQSSKTDCKNKLNTNVYSNPLLDLSLFEQKANPIFSSQDSNDSDQFALSLLRTFDLNHNTDDNIGS